MKHKDWQLFEETVEQIHKQLVPGGKIILNHIVKGVCKIDRQLDVTIQHILGGITNLYVVECKKYTRRVTITEVEAFSRKLQDVRAQRGIMISNGGFTTGAKAIADHDNIILRTVEEAKFTDWAQFNVPNSIPFFVLKYDSHKVFANIDETNTSIEIDLYSILLGEDGKTETIAEMIQRSIPREQFSAPCTVEFQIHTSPIPLDLNGKEYSTSSLRVIGEVTALRFDIPIQPDNGTVMKDVHSGSTVYAQLNSNSIDWKEIAKDLKEEDGRVVSLQEYTELASKGLIKLNENVRRYIRLQVVYTP